MYIQGAPLILDRYVVKQFIPIFMFAILLFVVLLLLIDLFLNLVHYLNFEASFKDILKVSFYYIPKGFSFALPMSLLFAVAYTLGDLYARNELTSIISSGIPFWRLARSLLIIGAIASVASFFFDDRIVIPTLKIKNDMTRTLRHQLVQQKNSDIVIKTKDGKRVYAVDYFDTKNRTLNGVSVVERDDDGNFVSQIRAASAQWNDTYWLFSNAVIYTWQEKDTIEKDSIERDVVVNDFISGMEDYNEDPDVFLRNSVAPEDLSAHDAGMLVRDLKSAGLPYIEAQADYYHRFSFPSVSFIVVILSISMGGRFRKNIMLMSLLTSLSVAVVFYIMEMITMMMAKTGYIAPIAGAWFPVFFFVALGVVLVRYSKT
ncbi:MAG: LptF/LptG family permease [Termitinemataceae bacterium]|nr:MAG: LptF/LptG family permease [Termitinemataceae bacterium]